MRMIDRLEAGQGTQEDVRLLLQVLDKAVANMGRRCFDCGRVGDWGQSHDKACVLRALYSDDRKEKKSDK